MLAARSTVLAIPYARRPDPEAARGRPASSARGPRDKLEKGRAPSRGYQSWFGRSATIWRWYFSQRGGRRLRLAAEAKLDASRLWVTAYANEVSGYVVSKRLIAEGGYEPRNSLSSQVTFGRPETLEPAMEDRIIERVKGLLPQGFHAEREAGEMAAAR